MPRSFFFRMQGTAGELAIPEKGMRATILAEASLLTTMRLRTAGVGAPETIEEDVTLEPREEATRMGGLAHGMTEVLAWRVGAATVAEQLAIGAAVDGPTLERTEVGGPSREDGLARRGDAVDTGAETFRCLDGTRGGTTEREDEAVATFKFGLRIAGGATTMDEAVTQVEDAAERTGFSSTLLTCVLENA